MSNNDLNKLLKKLVINKLFYKFKTVKDHEWVKKWI